MNQYRKLFLIPCMVLIIVSVTAGFAENSGDDLVKSMLKERAYVLQQAYYSYITIEEAEDRLAKIETQPILTDDINALRNAGPTDLDMVDSLEIRDLRQMNKLQEYLTYSGVIQWYMKGLTGEYVEEQQYFIVLKATDAAKSNYKLSELKPVYED